MKIIGFKLIVLFGLFIYPINSFALTRVLPQQPSPFWHAADWETTPGVSSSSPGIDDYVYIQCANEVFINTPETVRRLYLDRTIEGYPLTASILTVLPGGHLTVDSICQLGVDGSGGTVNVRGGQLTIAGTDRAGAWSLRLDFGGSARINVTGGILSIGGGSQVLSQPDSQSLIAVSNLGVLQIDQGASLALEAGNSKVQLSDHGKIIYCSTNAVSVVCSLAASGKMEGICPADVPEYIPMGTANGVGWYFDGEHTYVFAASSTDIQEQTYVVNLPRDVEDVTLRRSDLTYEEDSYWSEWNFGKSQVLDTGYATAVWNQFRAVTLLRFDLRGIGCQTVTSARFKIYKPMNVTQITSQVPVYLYSINSANKEWQEGRGQNHPLRLWRRPCAL